MHASQLTHLIKMANQIAINLGANGPEDEMAVQVANHLSKFWSPLMKRQICEYLDTGAPELQPLAAKAVAILKQQ